MLDVKKYIRVIPDFPKKGIMFQDFSELIADAEGFKKAIEALCDLPMSREADIIVGIESRGFIFGAPMAQCLGKGFVPVRKKGKLPGDTISITYDLEYGTDTVEMHKSAIPKGQKVVLIDDLIATGGTALAAVSLIRQLGAELTGVACVVDLPKVGGSNKLRQENIITEALYIYEGE